MTVKLHNKQNDSALSLSLTRALVAVSYENFHFRSKCVTAFATFCCVINTQGAASEAAQQSTRAYSNWNS